MISSTSKFDGVERDSDIQLAGAKRVRSMSAHPSNGILTAEERLLERANSVIVAYQDIRGVGDVSGDLTALELGEQTGEDLSTVFTILDQIHSGDEEALLAAYLEGMRITQFCGDVLAPYVVDRTGAGLAAVFDFIDRVEHFDEKSTS